MRKLITLMLALCLIAALAGCSSVPTSSSSGKQNDVSVEEAVLFDQNDLVITVKSIKMNGFVGPELNLMIENNGTQNVTVQTRDVSVNGVMAMPMFSCDVAAGKKANSELSIISSELEAAGIETISDIELKFFVFDSATWSDICLSDVITIQTSAFGTTTQTFDTTGTVILDQDGFKVIVKELDSENSFWGADVYLYVENNSDKNATIQLRDTSINGFMVDPIFSCDVIAGKKAFSSITFLESSLTDNGIQSIDELQFAFHLFDSATWSDIFDSDTVTVTFE